MKQDNSLFWTWLARKVPWKLAYFVAVRVVAFASTGKYGTTVVPNLSAIESIKRFGLKKV